MPVPIDTGLGHCFRSFARVTSSQDPCEPLHSLSRITGSIQSLRCTQVLTRDLYKVCETHTHTFTRSEPDALLGHFHRGSYHRTLPCKAHLLSIPQLIGRACVFQNGQLRFSFTKKNKTWVHAWVAKTNVGSLRREMFRGMYRRAHHIARNNTSFSLQKVISVRIGGAVAASSRMSE